MYSSPARGVIGSRTAESRSCRLEHSADQRSESDDCCSIVLLVCLRNEVGSQRHLRSRTPGSTRRIVASSWLVVLKQRTVGAPVRVKVSNQSAYDRREGDFSRWGAKQQHYHDTGSATPTAIKRGPRLKIRTFASVALLQQSTNSRFLALLSSCRTGYRPSPQLLKRGERWRDSSNLKLSFASDRLRKMPWLRVAVASSTRSG